MSDTQVKATPSKAAMELAEALFPDFTPEIHVEYADIIQAHVRDLLEKAKDTLSYRTRLMDDDSLRRGKLREALEPWEPK